MSLMWTGPPRTSSPSTTSGPTWRRRSTKLKEDLGIDCIASSAFGAHAADLELKVLAFNLHGLYPRPALGWAVVPRAKTLRRRVIAIAGQVIRTPGQWGLKLAKGWAGHADLARVRQHLATLRP
jgi:hypothetical protein